MKKRWWTLAVGICYCRTSLFWAFVLFVMLWITFPDTSLASGCKKKLPTKKREDELVRHEGYYTNHEYGYAVSIPTGFVGLSTPPPMPQHGFLIILSREPHGRLWVTGGHNAIDAWISSETMAEGYVKWITQGAKQVLSIEKQPVMLDGHSAIRLVARFQCSDDTRMVNDLFLIMLGEGAIEYSIGLESDAAIYAEYKPILEQMAASWQFRDPWDEVICGNAYPFSSPKEWESTTNWGRYTEEYTNQDYGYTVTIPAGLVGKSDYPTTPMYGVGMLLSHEGYLTVESACNWMKWASLDAAAEIYVKWITAEAYSVDSVEQQPTTLGGIPAIRFTVRYECPAETPMVKDLFLAISNNTVYKIDLITTATHYDDDKPILEQFAGTFRLTGAAKESCQWAEEGE